MIISSAIKFYEAGSEYPTIMTGHRHPDILMDMYKKGIVYDKITQVQGFMTDDFRFLDRVQAKKYAIECGQIKESEFSELYSEDLWPSRQV